MIRGITFSEQEFRSEDFAHFQNTFLNGNCGVTKGCEVTSSTNSVTINIGYFLVFGRFLNIEDAEVINSESFNNGYNRVVYEIDLSKENTVSEFRQGKIRVLPTTDLIQQNLDNGGKVYQFPFCHFNWDATTINGFVVDAKQLEMTDIWKKLIAEIEGMLGKIESITKKDVVVNVEDFAEDTTYAAYPYRAEITVASVTADFVPNVYFDVAQADSGMFSTVADTATDKVIIYAKDIPTEAFTIPVIRCVKEGSV